MSIVKFANEIIEMEDELNYLRGEVHRLQIIEAKFHELMKADLDHGAKMMVNIFSLLTVPGVCEALAAQHSVDDANDVKCNMHHIEETALVNLGKEGT